MTLLTIAVYAALIAIGMVLQFWYDVIFYNRIHRHKKGDP